MFIFPNRLKFLLWIESPRQMSWTPFIYICTCSIKNIVVILVASRAIRNSKGMLQLLSDGDSGVWKNNPMLRCTPQVQILLQMKVWYLSDEAYRCGLIIHRISIGCCSTWLEFLGYKTKEQFYVIDYRSILLNFLPYPWRFYWTSCLILEEKKNINLVGQTFERGKEKK